MRRLLSIALLAFLCSAVPAAAEMRFLKAWGQEGSGEGEFALPDGIGVDNAGTVWVADRDNNRVLKFTAEGRPRPFAPFARHHRSSKPGRFNLPYDVAPDALGNLYVADTHNHRIQLFSPKGELIRRWGSHGRGDGQFDQPRDLTVDAFGNVWVADHENKRVQKFDRDGRFLLKVGANGGDGTLGSGPGEFNSPRGLSSDPQGNIYVADDANHRIVKLANDGSFIAHFGKDGGGWDKAGTGPGEFKLPYGTAVDREGHVWVADTEGNRVEEIDPLDGRFLSVWGANGGDGTPGAGPGEFENPYNIATDCAGNVYVTDQSNHRVQKLGDPAFPRPVCPPRLTAVSVRRSGRVLTATGTCDRPCRLRVEGGGRRGRDTLLWSGGAGSARLKLPHARRVRVRVVAEGAPGARSAVSAGRR